MSSDSKKLSKNKNFFDSFWFGIIIWIAILAILMHPDIISNPIERFNALPDAGAYGFGAFHPLVFALISYPIFVVFKAIFKAILKFLKKQK